MKKKERKTEWNFKLGRLYRRNLYQNVAGTCSGQVHQKQKKTLIMV
jgi:asparagine N-glycosylation enzyme membrane subunit Stt3